MEPEKKSNIPLVIGGLALILIVVGLFVYKGMQKPAPQVESAQVESVATPAEGVPSSVPTGPVKEFTVVGKNFSFSPATITVNQGDTVKINFQDSDGHHNLVIDGYNVSTDTLETGDSTSVTFVADKAGSFQYYCSVPTHKDKGMVGTLIVQ